MFGSFYPEFFTMLTMCFLFGVLVVRFLQVGDGSVCAWRYCFLQSFDNNDWYRTAALSITVTSPGVQYCDVSYSLIYAIRPRR
jgi:hypothetical protein